MIKDDRGAVPLSTNPPELEHRLWPPFPVVRMKSFELLPGSTKMISKSILYAKRIPEIGQNLESQGKSQWRKEMDFPKTPKSWWSADILSSLTGRHCNIVSTCRSTPNVSTSLWWRMDNFSWKISHTSFGNFSQEYIFWQYSSSQIKPPLQSPQKSPNFVKLNLLPENLLTITHRYDLPRREVSPVTKAGHDPGGVHPPFILIIIKPSARLALKRETAKQSCCCCEIEVEINSSHFL